MCTTGVTDAGSKFAAGAIDPGFQQWHQYNIPKPYIEHLRYTSMR